MTYVVLMLLIALAGTAEDAPAPPEGVIPEECGFASCDTPPPPPSELQGPPPARVGGPSGF